MLVGIALLPPQSIVDFVLEKEHYLSEKYTTFGGLSQPPHVTIKWPFESTSLEPFEAYCETIAQQKPPIVIKYTGYGYFDPSTLFLSVHPSEELVALHLGVLNDLKQKFNIEPLPFEGVSQQFHTTLVMDDISPENFKQAKEEMSTWYVPQAVNNFTAFELALFRKNKNIWVIHSKYRLKA